MFVNTFLKKIVKNYILLFLNQKSKVYGIASGFISNLNSHLLNVSFPESFT